ncbi:phage antirepressor KilAC domain-containing protein [Metapseudomonas otitidis]|uniref:phage antirepressor KilAC domain-containing protein n=1 Tax=Metapseudomonas otitidis TaxID=319939 RepID=UPI00260BD34F|nr:phage antirepressor KilAC domain-containing protein [Pseudomonas otitidis]
MARSYDLKEAAEHLGLTRPKLIAALRERDLLGPDRLPRHPARDALYLITREGNWYHPRLGPQYSRSTRVTEAGLRWLEQKLDIQRPLPEPKADPRDVA